MLPPFLYHCMGRRVQTPKHHQHQQAGQTSGDRGYHTRDNLALHNLTTHGTIWHCIIVVCCGTFSTKRGILCVSLVSNNGSEEVLCHIRNINVQPLSKTRLTIDAVEESLQPVHLTIHLSTFGTPKC
jgi:hypothetical protein